MAIAISLHQRVSNPGTVHVWVGITGVTAAPAIEVSVDGTLVPNPRFIRPFAPVRSGDMVAGNEAQTFTAVLELPAGRVKVTAGGASSELTARPIAAAVPRWGFESPFRILLASCFDRRTDKNVAGRLVKSLVDKQRPDMSIFLGDQVYLDLPTFQDLGMQTRDMAVAFERKYVDNWFTDRTGYHELLQAAPAVFAADDHEYWNNFPHAAPYMDNTWDGTVRERWRRAAVATWNAFQLHPGHAAGDAIRIDFPRPLSILVVDTRADRTRDYRHVMSDAAAQSVRDWVDFVIENDRIAVLVTGQSIFEKPAGAFGKRFKDARLADHDDYPVLVAALSRLVANGRPVLCLTGDVHYGRVLTIENTLKANRLYEVISSPISLVENVLADLARPVTSLFKPRSDWPRHSSPSSEPFTLQSFGGEFDFRTKFGQRGNHIVLLTMGSFGTAVRVKASFHPLHPTKANPASEFEFDLR